MTSWETIQPIFLLNLNLCNPGICQFQYLQAYEHGDDDARVASHVRSHSSYLLTGDGAYGVYGIDVGRGIGSEQARGYNDGQQACLTNQRIFRACTHLLDFV